MINKKVTIMLLTPTLVFSLLFYIISPENRGVSLFFFIIGVLAWFFLFIKKIRFFTSDKDDNKLLKYVFYPIMILNIILLIINKDYRDSGAGYIYAVVGLLSYLIYMTSGFTQFTIGIGKKLGLNVFIGVLVGVGFIIISKIVPGFSLLQPEIPFSIGTQIKFLIVVIFASPVEEILFRSSLPSILMSAFNFSWGIIVGICSILFAGAHLLAYGVYTSSLDNLIQLYGATTAISGAIVAAIIWSIASFVLIKKTQSLIPSIVGHTTINFIVFTALSFVSLFSFG
ncbi:MAG: CPBP family intramembrane glutamic endopeptidase [Nanoarchaeota archaeon]